MTIPDYQTVMLPLLKFSADEQEHSLRDAIDTLADEFKLTEAERKELLPSGQQEVFNNRVGWARTYMKKAGLLETTRRGHFRITTRGLQVLDKKPPHIDVKFLEQFDRFQEFRVLRHTRSQNATIEVEEPETTPEEAPHTSFFGTISPAIFFSKSGQVLPLFLKRLSSNFWSRWDTVGAGRTQGVRSGKVEMKE
jgi:restriction endonuclease Mrr